MKVVIVEDELIIADYIRSIVESNGHTCLKITDNYIDAKKCLELKPDVFLLDIQLDKLKDGILIADELSKNNVPYIFITANNETDVMLEAIKKKPLAYLTKPIKPNDLLAALALFESRLPKQIEIREKGKGKRQISLSDILYCKAEGSYTTFVLENEEIVQRAVLSDISPLLDDKFCRVHRSFIINARRIESFQNNEVTIQGHQIPVSRSYKEQMPSCMAKKF